MPFFSVSFGSAQTDTQLIVGKAHKKIVVTRYLICVDNDSVDVTVNLGFGTSTLTSIFTGHPNLPSALQIGEVFNERSLVEGALGESLLFTCTVPTGGSVQVSVTYEIHDFTKGNG